MIVSEATPGLPASSAEVLLGLLPMLKCREPSLQAVLPPARKRGLSKPGCLRSPTPLLMELLGASVLVWPVHRWVPSLAWCPAHSEL